MRDPYTVLGLRRGASEGDLKKAYHRLAKRLHPDLNPGNHTVEQQFKEVTGAYELLSDPARRQRFDRGEIDAAGNEIHRAFRGGARSAPGGAPPPEGFSIDEVFAEFLGRNRRTAQQRAGATAGGASAAVPLHLGFLEAALGGKRRVEMPDGRSFEVAVPAGVESGQKLRLRGSNGHDVLLAVEIAPHSHFTRQGRDIHLELPVTLAEAALGATVTVPTIHGAVTVKVPRGSNTGAVLRLKGRGIGGSGGGDHYVKLLVVLPDPPDPELTAFLERWAKSHAYAVRGKLDTV